VGAEYRVTSCDLGIFVNQAAEPVPPQNPDTCDCCGWILASGGRVLVQRPLAVVMPRVLGQDLPEMLFAENQHVIETLPT